jgi:hypothetical protein
MFILACIGLTVFGCSRRSGNTDLPPTFFGGAKGDEYERLESLLTDKVRTNRPYLTCAWFDPQSGGKGILHLAWIDQQDDVVGLQVLAYSSPFQYQVSNEFGAFAHSRKGRRQTVWHYESLCALIDVGNALQLAGNLWHEYESGLREVPPFIPLQWSETQQTVYLALYDSEGYYSNFKAIVINPSKGEEQSGN